MRSLAITVCVVMGAAIMTASAEAVDNLADAAETKKSAKVSKNGKKVRRTKSAKKNPVAIYSKRRAKLMPIVKSAKVGNLPIGLVDAVISKESKYNVNAKGSRGEIGLMQLLPSTARRIAKTLGHKRVAKMSNKDLRTYLTNPRNNIRYGTTYLAKCHKMAKGNIGATIGCYNAGPGNMWRWSKIKITNKYVQYVRRHMAGNS